MGWSESDLCGPEGEDWRVPVSELENRQSNLAKALDFTGLDGALLHNPVDLYYYCGGRQNGAMYIPAESKEILPVQFVRRSLKRAEFEAGGDNAVHEIVKFPSLSQFSENLNSRGINKMPSMQLSSIPHSFGTRFKKALSGLKGELQDCNGLIHQMREKKSSWEIEQMRIA
ncbi:MAG TPA: aminopeptidase P family N-terminal domain-containing protein, partial [Candidatus Poseidoniaceae archaeon]|nr:aminopeptidase P family N-terminal domain-containing protein [Candidatus Poseidoniaceae archaeon]